MITHQPCHKTWGELASTGSAEVKFCSECSRNIIDFTASSDAEIKAYLLEHKGKRVCGTINSTEQESLWHQTKNRLSTLPYFLIVLVFVGSFILHGCSNKKKTSRLKNPGYLQLEEIE